MKNGTNFFKNHLNVYHFEDLNEMILNFFSNSTFRSVDNGIFKFLPCILTKGKSEH